MRSHSFLHRNKVTHDVLMPTSLSRLAYQAGWVSALTEIELSRSRVLLTLDCIRTCKSSRQSIDQEECQCSKKPYERIRTVTTSYDWLRKDVKYNPEQA